MNTRDYKSFAPNEYYHIFNRGVGRMDIFQDDEDYKNFLYRLKVVLSLEIKPKLRIKPVPKDSFTIVSFCLMPNHFHILLRQNGEVPVNSLFSKLGTSYAMYFNKKYKRVGALFQDTFKAINIDDNKYLLWLSAYIHQNPAVAGLVWDLKQWKWSSYIEYLSKDGGLSDMDILLGQFKSKSDYKEFVESSFDEIARVKRDNNIFLD